MSKAKPAVAAPKDTNVSWMRKFYTKNVIPNLDNTPFADLRGNALVTAQDARDCSLASAASAFNVVQKENLAAGTVKATQVGRGATAAKIGPDLSLPWATINKATRVVTGTYPSRASAKKAKSADDTVGRTPTS